MAMSELYGFYGWVAFHSGFKGVKLWLWFSTWFLASLNLFFGRRISGRWPLASLRFEILH